MGKKTIWVYLIALFSLVPLLQYSQDCADCRYISYMFDSVEVHTEQFGAGINSDGQNQQLFMDIYEPFGDTLSNRPLVIFAFGGGFLQGSRDEGYVVRGCRRFARAGYVAAAIDYRTGFSIPGLFPSPSEELMRVFFRAMQDMRGAVQWFRASADQFANPYRINPDRVFVGGASAGAITAIMMTYCEDSSEFEELGSLNALDQLGGFYSSSGLYPGYSWMPQGVFNIAGAIVNVDWMKPGDPPIISTHGDQDGTVPYQGGNIDFGFVSLGLEGSYNIDQRADSLGICSYLYTIAGGDHPSGNAPETYFDEIYLRALPLLHAQVNDRSFCCPLTLDMRPDTIMNYQPGYPVSVTMNVTNDSGNVRTFYCGSACSPGSTNIPNDYLLYAWQEHFYLIGIAEEGNCQATDFSYFDPGMLVVGVDPKDLLTDFTLSPNPASDHLTLQLGSSFKGKTTVRLRDITGKVLQEAWLQHREQEINVSQLPRGIYILELKNQGKSGIQKIILE